MKKFKTIICGLLAVSLLSGCTDSGSVAEGTTTAVPVSAEPADFAVASLDVKNIGRTYQQDDVLWLGLSGSGIEFEITAKSASVTIVGNEAASVANNTGNWARIGVYVDGERVCDQQIDSATKTLDIFSGSEVRTATVSILKLSECAMSVAGISAITTDGNAVIKATAEKEHYIEFIGDSITCGYGVDDEDRDHHFETATEDVTRAYAYKTAHTLNADYSMVSFSGYGIISGYSDDGAIEAGQTVGQYYDKIGFCYGTFAGTRPSDLTYDFARQPDVVVINLGTNDASYCKDDEKKAAFEAGYVEFLKLVREKNPDAQIICAYGTMGSDLFLNIMNAVKTYSDETGDGKVAYMKFFQQSSADGYAADWHPTEATHIKSAKQLSEKITELMGW